MPPPSADIRSKDQIFYLPLEQRPPTAGCKQLLESYSQIPAQDLDAHISSVRDLAWHHHPYPSIGLFIFLDLGLSGDDLPASGPSYPAQDGPHAVATTKTAYQTILQKLQAPGGKFLDVGCMFAQDTRKLVHDGAPPTSVYGTDLHGEYFEYGYALFRDEQVIPKDHFIAADILDADAPGLRHLQGTFDVVNATHVVHVFSIDDQLVLLQRLVSLLKDEKGTMVTGRLTGHDIAGYHQPANAKATVKAGKGEIWEHNTESFRELWKRVERETGTEWDVKCWMWKFGTHTAIPGNEKWFRSKENGIITFIATRA